MQLILLALSLLIPAPTLVIHVQTENGAAIVGLEVEYRQENGALNGRCTTDSNGRCEIQLTGDLNDGDIIRGVLDFGASGNRSLIWVVPEQPAELTISLNEFGQVIIPGHHTHPTPESFSDVSPTPLPILTIQPTVEPLATTEFVVIDLTDAAEVEPIPTLIESLEAIEAELASSAEATATPSTVEAEQALAVNWLMRGILIALFVGLWIGVIAWIWRRQNA